ncbi:hypothetical protein [Bradyrhizobium zhanjiangense]|uniref:hypothetical protein n=1 Tax=Bradyrhizobium zhanjiangense TaxID=1325107 RepID=UPI001008EA9B
MIGWSRHTREISGVRCLSGLDNLAVALSSAEILVALLPETPHTINLLDAKALRLR